ncbi:MAG TPA: hypothetical protein VMF69_09935 [Gemmataceae bacterium]|nr:hypothetical protein [Gemmataceae bacterium]
MPKALGIAPTSQKALKRIGDKENLAAILLRELFELPVGPFPSFGAVLNALACKELGFPEATNLEEVKQLILSRRIGSDERLDTGTLKKALPRVLLGTKSRGISGLRAVLLMGWADCSKLPTPPPMPPQEQLRDEPTPAGFDLPAFAQTVKAAARDCPTGRFGDNKVFISHLWRRLQDEPAFPVMDLPTFKQRLTEANNSHLLTLSRADLVQVMDPVDVQESLTTYLNGEFHFVLVEREQS